MAVYFKGKLIGSSSGENAPKTIPYSGSSNYINPTGTSTLTIIDTKTGKIVQKGTTGSSRITDLSNYTSPENSPAPIESKTVVSNVNESVLKKTLNQPTQTLTQSFGQAGVSSDTLNQAKTGLNKAISQRTVQEQDAINLAAQISQNYNTEVQRQQDLRNQLVNANNATPLYDQIGNLPQNQPKNYPPDTRTNMPRQYVPQQTEEVQPNKLTTGKPSSPLRMETQKAPIDTLLGTGFFDKQGIKNIETEQTYGQLENTPYYAEKPGQILMVQEGKLVSATGEERLQAIKDITSSQAEKFATTILAIEPINVLQKAGKGILNKLLEPQIVKIGEQKVIQTLTKEGEAKLLTSQNIILKSRIGIPRTFNIASTGEATLIDTKEFIDLFNKTAAKDFKPIITLQKKLPGYSGIKVGETTLLLPEKIVLQATKEVGGVPTIVKNNLVDYIKLISAGASKSKNIGIKSIGEPFVIKSEALVYSRKVGLIEQFAKDTGFVKELDFEKQIIKDFKKSIKAKFVRPEEFKGLSFGLMEERKIVGLGKGMKQGFSKGGYSQKYLDLLRIEDNKTKLLSENVNNNFVKLKKNELGDFVGISRSKGFGGKFGSLEKFSLTGTKGKIRLVEVKSEEISVSSIRKFKTQELSLKLNGKEFNASRVKVSGFPESKILVKEVKPETFKSAWGSGGVVSGKKVLLKGKVGGLKQITEIKSSIKFLPKDEFTPPSVSNDVIDNILNKISPVKNEVKRDLSLGSQNRVLNIGMGSVQELQQKVIPKVITKSLEESKSSLLTGSKILLKQVVGVSGKVYSVSESASKSKVGSSFAKTEAKSKVRVESVFAKTSSSSKIVPVLKTGNVFTGTSIRTKTAFAGTAFAEPKLSYGASSMGSTKLDYGAATSSKLKYAYGTANKVRFAESEKLRMRVPFMPRVFVPKVPIPKVPIPGIPFNFNLDKNVVLPNFGLNKKSSRAFSVFSRVKGKKKLLAFGVPRNLAIAVGKRFTDVTTARSFRIQEVGVTRRGDIGNQDLTQYRTPKLGGRVSREGFTFVEKSKFAIDTPGEIQGLRVGKFTAKLFK